MLLTISTRHQPATDLGYLLHKHPDRLQSFELSFGHAHVFYRQAAVESCTACLLLDVDPVDMVRGKLRDQSFLLGHYVNDRPYVASSFMSVAIAQVLGSAMGGRCKDRPELATTPIPLEARLDVLPARGGKDLIHQLFEPLGYEVTADELPLDEHFPEWGKSPFYSVTIRQTCTLASLLTHLYVLIPVFDNEKHYFVGEDELEKLLDKGAGWLAQHPQKEQITRRYLRHRTSLFRQALARLVDDESTTKVDSTASPQPEERLERELSLHDRRHATVIAAIKASGARRVLDLGCGEGKLLRELMKDRQFEEIVGMDVSIRSLELAHKRLKVDRLSERQADRLKLIHGSLTYRDKRLTGFDAAALIEVIEHLDPPRLSACERAVFEFARPGTVLLTTPNREYNVMWESLPAGQFRHADHRFEWTRAEFHEWAEKIATRFGYNVRFQPIGPEDEQYGPPTQMAVFQLLH
jgi:3' terminal RNA ribose 2'-O-methyltransferase Hen1